MKITAFRILILVSIFYPAASRSQSWIELNPPPNIFNDAIFTLANDSSGVIYAAGKFKNINNKYVVAKWKNGTWAEVENGTDSLKGDNWIFGLAVDKIGNLYAAGAFTNAIGYSYVAKWNDTTWSQVGTGTNALNPGGQIYAIATDLSNNIYAGGSFTNASGKQYVAKWNGITWTELGTGANALNGNGHIYSIATDGSGNVYAAGHLKNVSGKYYVAKWNGTAWTELGTETNALNANDYINTIKTDNAGNIYAAGSFRNALGEYYVAKFNGSSWSELGSGANSLKANGVINSIVVTNTGLVYAGGYCTNNINGLTNVVKWDGTSWSQVFDVGGAPNNPIRSIIADASGNIYAGGDFRNANSHSYVGKWNGTILKELGRQGEYLPNPNGIKLVIADKFGYVYAVGQFWNPTNNPLTMVAKWDGVGWRPLRSTTLPFDVEQVEAMTTDSSGNVYAGGRFQNLNGEYCVAKWDGANWIELTGATTSIHAVDYINSLNTDSTGNIYATGFFIENNTGYGIAKWDGTNWTKLSSVPVSSFGGIKFGPQDGVYVIGPYQNYFSQNYVAKVEPDGSWHELGTGTNALIANGFIRSIAVDRKNGNAYAGGTFFNSNGVRYVAKWNGTNWSELGSLPDNSLVSAIVTDTSGNVYASLHRSALPNSYIGKWNGTSWTEFSGDNQFNFTSDITSLYKDHLENFYAAPYYNVFAHGRSVLILRKPALTSSPNNYCSNATGTQSIKILNLGDTSRVHVLVKLDNATLPVNADSSFSFTASSLTPGTHRLTVFFYIGSDSMYTIKDFMINSSGAPEVNISASTTVVNILNPVTITATNAAGGGTAPLYTFARDGAITTILQAESANNVYILDPNILSVGDNWIYVRMRSNSTCNLNQTNIDSIKITRSAATGLTDIDFPDQRIIIYPNPFGGSISINGLQLSKSYTVTLVNSLGQALLKRTVRNRTETKINQQVPSGIYWLSIYDITKKRLVGSEALIKN
jgi:hypothetical protein